MQRTIRQLAQLAAAFVPFVATSAIAVEEKHIDSLEYRLKTSSK